MEKMLRDAMSEIKEHLENGIIPFWLTRGNDPEYGGYFTTTDEYDAVVIETEKYIVTQTRMIWGFSALYRRYPTDKRLLESARQGVDFFIRNFWDKEFGGWFWKTSRDGTPTDMGKLVYGQGFAIYALAEYTRASGDPRGLEYAEKTFDLLMKYCADTVRGGFYENLERDWRVSEPGFSAGDRKSLDIHMHLLEALSTLSAVSRKEVHMRRLEEVIDVILKRMINLNAGCGRNQFDLDFHPIPAINIRRTWNAERVKGETVAAPTDTTSYGHNLELAWLLDDAAVVMGKPRGYYGEWMRKLTDHALRYGIDTEYGGVYRDGPSDGPALVKDKEWWQNCEALTGLLYDYRCFGEERYARAFLDVWKFDKTYFINPNLGEWRPLLTREGKVIDGRIGNPWKAIYHTGRAMLESLQCLEDLLP